MSSIEKNEKRETLADIVAEIRRDIKLGNNYYAANLPDRIEAAWKRDEERAIEHATHHAESVARDNCRDCIHNHNGKNYEPIGNAAALREAVVALLDSLDSLGCDENTAALAAFVPGMEDSSAKCLAAFRKAKAALSAPARNCDSYKDAPSAYADFIVPWKLDGHLDDVPTLQDFANWLFATAEERKGEGDGK